MTDLTTTTQETLDSLSAAIKALPEDRTLPTQEERDWVAAERQTLIGRQGHLHRLLYSLTSYATTDAALRDWQEVLTTAVSEFEAELATLEDTRRRQADPRAADRHANALRASLVLLQRGPESYGSGECLTDALVAWFEAHGVHAVNGRWFQDRGGLTQVTHRLDDAQRGRDLGERELSHYLGVYTSDTASVHEAARS